MKASLHVVRNPKQVVLTGRNSVIFPKACGAGIRHTTKEPARWSELLQRLSYPAKLACLQSLGAMPEDLDEALIDRLVEEEHFLADRDPETLEKRRRDVFTNSPAFHLISRAKACEHLLIGCTGSVVAGLMPQTLLSLCYSGFQDQLDVILTENAQRFISRDMLEAYGIRTWANGFERRDDIRVPHVRLAQSADAIVVVPATADLLQRVASGACSDLLSLCIAASGTPTLMVPAMNDRMWNDPAIQRNVRRIREDGRYIVEPTFIFGAADFEHDATPMYGGHGTLWAGAASLMAAVESVLDVGRATSP